MSITYRLDPFPTNADLSRIWGPAWGASWAGNLDQILRRSLVHACAYDGDRLVGYVNVAWDGGCHAFLLDTTVDIAYQRQGIARRLVRLVADAARERGADWLHVDYTPEHAPFYQACGFHPTLAGLVDLTRSGTDT